MSRLSVSTTLLAAIAIGQLGFFCLLFVVLLVRRGREHRHAGARRRLEEQVALLVDRLLAGDLAPAAFGAALAAHRHRAVGAVILRQVAILPPPDRVRVGDAVRTSPWFQRHVVRRAAARLWWHRLESARLLSVLAREEDAAVAAPLIADPHPAVRLAAIDLVRRIPLPDLLEAALDQAIASRPVVRRYCLDVIVRSRDHARPIIARRLAAGGPVATLRALLELAGDLADPALLDQVLAFAAHDEFEVRTAAARALGAWGDGRVTGTLIRLLADTAWEVRTQAAAALGRRGAVEARDALHRALGDANWWVRLRAAIALRQIGEDGEAALRDAATGPDRFAREMARYVLGLSPDAVRDYRA